MQYWTEHEDETLRGMYPTESVEIIAMQLERTKAAVQQRASLLKLRRVPGWNRWTQKVETP